MKNTGSSINSALHAAKKAASALLALVLFALFPLSCAKDAPAPDEPTPSPAPPSSSPSPLSGGVLRMAMPENLSVGNENYDPLLVRTEEELALFSLVYEPLIAVNEANELVPCLAAKWSRFQGDERSWLVSLRESAVFHTGEKLCADDVVQSFNRLKRLGGEGYYSRSLAYVTSMVRVDDATVRVNMVTPGIIALYALDFPIMKADGSVFNGTGPYSAFSFSDERIVLHANDSWWDRTPYINVVEFLSRDSSDTALASYTAGQLDFVQTAQLSAGQYADNGVTAVSDHMTQEMEVMLFNHRRHPTMDADFRRAVARAVNRSPIISNIYMNRARACDVPVPPDSWLYTGETLIGYDHAAAISYFEKAGCTQNEAGRMLHGGAELELKLLVSGTTDNTTRSDAALAIASQLEGFGIAAKVVILPHGYGEAESEFLSALTEMDWDIALVGFSLSLSNDLSAYLTTEGRNNFGKCSGVLFAEELKKVRSASDEQALRSAFRELEAAFIDQLPFMVLYFRLNSAVYTEKLRGVASLREPMLLRGIKSWYFAG